MPKLNLEPNQSLLLDMTFAELEGVPEDYDSPDDILEIQWVVENASFTCKENGESGVYDFIFNLGMLDCYAQAGGPKHTIAQLEKLRESGYSYILFHQGC